MDSTIRNLKFQALSAICLIIDKALDLKTSFSAILHILAERLAMKRATITLYDTDTDSLHIFASHGLSPQERSRGVYKLGEGVTGRIFQTDKPYYVPDITNEPLFLDKTGARGKIKRARISFLGVPIRLDGRPIGVLNVDRLFGDDVDFHEDLDFLTVVATLLGQFLSLNEKIREREEILVQENASLKYEVSKIRGGGPYIVAKSASMLDVERQMARVAPTKATVLLLGESGVGKTLIARIIHELSDRKQHSFMKINCASLPETLLEAELFGCEKGAFTGATSTRAGRFEEAHLGTLFLDEIGEMPLSIQAKLLRVIQDKEFERLGSNRTRTSDVRIMAATNRDLEKLVEQGQFRLDLFYRLHVFPIIVPPLRERKEDIPSLLNHFVLKVSREYGRDISFTPAALEVLRQHDWPGNVREMENMIERLVIMSDSNRIESDFLYNYLTPSQPASSTSPPVTQQKTSTSLKDVEYNELVSALQRSDWVQYKAAKELGLTPRQMGYRVKKFGLQKMIAKGRAGIL